MNKQKKRSSETEILLKPQIYMVKLGVIIRSPVLLGICVHVNNIFREDTKKTHYIKKTSPKQNRHTSKAKPRTARHRNSNKQTNKTRLGLLQEVDRQALAVPTPFRRFWCGSSSWTSTTTSRPQLTANPRLRFAPRVP